MVPRKSILKGPLNPSPEALADESNATQAMDFTEVVKRRVSFAPQAYVRVFTKDTKNNGSDAPSSSPEQPAVHFVNDENEHPEDASRSRRRSSRRRSSTTFSDYGERSMDMDEDDAGAPDPSEFENGEIYFDDDFDNGDQDDLGLDGEFEDMDITESLDQRIVRKRSLSMGGRKSLPLRRRSSTVPVATSSHSQSENQPPLSSTASGGQEQDYEQDTIGSQSFMSEGSSGEHTAPMEFTIPMGQALQPASEDPIWQQLRAATHAGPTEPASDDYTHEEGDHTSEPMELTTAMTRLLVARQSVGLPPPSGPLVSSQPPTDDADLGLDGSFTDDGSFRDLGDLGDQTINVTQTIHRSSLGSQDMDETDVVQADLAVASSSATAKPTPVSEPQPSPTSVQPSQPPAQLARLPEPPRVFSAPPPKAPVAMRSPAKTSSSAFPDRPFTFTLPPKASTSTPAAPRSPSKLPVFRGTAAFAPPTMPKSPRKRPAPDEPTTSHEADQPSPAKKQAIERSSPAKPGPVSSDKASAAVPPVRKPGALRRPSGYFAQRKSLGAGLGVAPPMASNSQSSHRLSGRASLGSTSTTQDGLYPDLEALQKDMPTIPSQPAARPGPSKPTTSQTPSPPAAASSSRTSNSPPHVPASVPALSPTSLYPSAESSTSSFERRRSAVSTAPAAQAAIPAQSEQTTDEQPEEEPYDGTEPDFTQQFREEPQEAGIAEEENVGITLEQFFDMTGIRFMDQITVPRRQSLHAPQQLHEVVQIPLAEFITAMAIDIPQLELYSTVARQLETWVEESRKICHEADEEARQVVPQVFQDFLESDGEDRGFLIHQLKIVKTNNYGTAKSQLYDWKKDWTEQLRVAADATFADLQSDAKNLESINAQAQAMLPALREEYEQVMKELEAERADIAEIESDDPEYLAELKATIAEQDAELQVYRADVSEAKAKLSRLEEKLSELEDQKKEASAAISDAERIILIQKESTSAEVFKLKDELEALEDLHMWRCAKLSADSVELVYASRYEVTIPCDDFKPIPSRVNVQKVKGFQLKERSTFPQLMQLMLEGAPLLVRSSQANMSLQQIVQRLNDFWSSCAQFKSQLGFLAIKYPVSVDLQATQDNLPTMIARATVLFPSAKAKAFVSFILDAQSYSSWPMSIQSLRADVQVSYGRVDRDILLAAVSSRLAQATPSDNHCCLLDACIEAAEQYP
ncbi:hypothetical protein EIP91_007535 [Steccherinum ochraceum]|uniref:Spc7 kinetochore protein domain-containing protein n=1 Tax=Steccherinum ochraceum TaxID=92696 RepID=A0A4R0R441_9APHY|nr:hypothetical protein EIP91_007535 [Steccherinum ochraceum]